MALLHNCSTRPDVGGCVPEMCVLHRCCAFCVLECRPSGLPADEHLCPHEHQHDQHDNRNKQINTKNHIIIVIIIKIVSIFMCRTGNLQLCIHTSPCLVLHIAPLWRKIIPWIRKHDWWARSAAICKCPLRPASYTLDTRWGLSRTQHYPVNLLQLNWILNFSTLFINHVVGPAYFSLNKLFVDHTALPYCPLAKTCKCSLYFAQM